MYEFGKRARGVRRATVPLLTEEFVLYFPKSRAKRSTPERFLGMHETHCSRIVLWWTWLFVIVTAAAWLSSDANAALLTDDTQQSFRFRFVVKGYEANSWFEDPSSLAVDERSGLVYVADTKSGAVDGFSLQGIAKLQYGTKDGLKAPIGLAVDRAGNLYVSENDGGSIKVIDSRRQVTTVEIPADDSAGGDPPKPGRMTFDQDGNLYIVDRANCRILVFDKQRKFKRRFGAVGDKRGEFKLPQDVAVDRQGRIYVTDAIGTPVQVFDSKGGYLYGFGDRGEGTQSLSFPGGVFVDRHDQVWVVDKTQHCLKVFDRLGMFLRTFGTYGQGQGSFFYPIDASVDDLGQVYILESGARRLQVFSLGRPFEPFSQ